MRRFRGRRRFRRGRRRIMVRRRGRVGRRRLRRIGFRM